MNIHSSTVWYGNSNLRLLLVPDGPRQPSFFVVLEVYENTSKCGELELYLVIFFSHPPKDFVRMD